MLLLAFIASIITTAVMVLCVSWSNACLFTVLDYDGDEPVLGYRLLTIPARIVAVCITIASVCICAISWAYVITSFLLIIL